MSIELLKRIIVGKNHRRTLIRAVILAIFCIILFRFFLIPVRIQGISMEPTYHNGAVNLVNTMYYKFHDFKRSDIVAVAIGSGHKYMYLKRIVGLPNEKVAFRAGKLLINGKIIDEPYIVYECDWYMAEVLVGENEYYVVGDNRSGPISGHEKGRVDKNKIMGRPLW
jgi:signal peptidase I